MSATLPLLLGPADTRYGETSAAVWDVILSRNGKTRNVRELTNAELIRYCIRPKTVSARVEASFVYATDPPVTVDETSTYEMAPADTLGSVSVWDKLGPISWASVFGEPKTLIFLSPSYFETSDNGRSLPLNLAPILQYGKFYLEQNHTLVSVSGPSSYFFTTVDLDDPPPGWVVSCNVTYTSTQIKIETRQEFGPTGGRTIKTSTITLTITSQFDP